MWVGDLAGNWDYCTTFIEIQDNFYACGPGSRMGGKITNEDNNSVQDVTIQLSGSTSNDILTGVNGGYSFGNIPHGNDYTITPLKDDKPTNGVSTYDLVLISKHILNVEKIRFSL